jgi:hypothetical protein
MLGAETRGTFSFRGKVRREKLMKTRRIVWCFVAIAGCASEVRTVPSDEAKDAGADVYEEKLPDGAPCDVDAQCESDACIPSKNSFGMGYCFSASTEGCIVVTSPSPFKSSCPDPKILYTCGDAFDVSTLGMCEIVGAGKLLEFYHCCPKP